MRIILISNYPNDRQESMQRFAQALADGLQEAGQEVQLRSPVPIFGRLKPSPTGFGKWLGYIDKFILFPFTLRRLARRAKREGNTRFHICDHSNAMYERWLRDVPQLLTCHDLLAVRSALGEIPENPTGWSGKCLQTWILKSLGKAKQIVCVSKSTAEDLKRLTRHSDVSCSVIYNGLNYPYRRMQKAEREEPLQNLGNHVGHKLPTPYLFHVGGTQWYKNRLGLLQIYKALRGIEPATPALLIAGKANTPECQTFIESNHLSEFVLHVGRVSNEDLNALYSGAEAFLFPSLAEGFGWPIIEAQACGCPVVTTDRAPMSEIGGDAATYIDPEKPTEAAAQIADLLRENAESQEQRASNGLAHAADFTARKMVDSYVDLYASMLES